jgi:uncharacterized membrane protein YozB (DUF420 family)
MLANLRPWHGYLVVVVVLFVASLFIPVDDAFPPGHKVLDPAKATLDLIDGIIKLMVPLTTIMVTAAAALAVKGNTWTSRWATLDSLLIVCVFLCGAVAYFGVYLCYMRILTMVSLASIFVREGGLLWGLKLQYFGIIMGFACLGLVFTRIIEGRLTKSPGG